MKYAIIENGLVTNMVLSESLSFAEAQGWVVANDEVEIGHSYVDSSFVTPVPTPKTDDELAAEVRADRGIRLVEVDDVAGNALRWSALDADKQATWATYRRDLLDITDQDSFPHNVTWPTKPE